MTTILIAAMLCADPGAFSPVVKIDNDGGHSSGVVYHHYGEKKTQFLILTCAHGKKKDQRQNVWFGGTQNVMAEGRLLAIDQKRDLAVVYVEAAHLEKVRAMRIAKEDLVAGERVRIMGYGVRAEKRAYFTDRQTTVVGLQQLNVQGNVRQRLRVKGETKPGDSGGVLVDANGELVGITNARSFDRRDVDGFFVTQADIKEFLAEEELLP